MEKFNLNIAEDKIPKHKSVHKFGRNDAVGTSFVPVAMGGVYQTPLSSSATTLRIAAGNANDTAAGTGAREVLLFGIDENGDHASEAVATAGASASSATSTTFMRLYRAYVSSSGTYATQSAGSHAGDIVIENGAGGTTWATLSSTDFPKAQSEIGVYTIARGKKGYIPNMKIFADSTKTTDIIFFQRTDILRTSAPHAAMRMATDITITGGESDIMVSTPMGPFIGPCDIGFMAKVDQTTAAVEVDFEIIEVDDV